MLRMVQISSQNSANQRGNNFINILQAVFSVKCQMQLFHTYSLRLYIFGKKAAYKNLVSLRPISKLKCCNTFKVI